jgi:chemotaxis protein MotB
VPGLAEHKDQLIMEETPEGLHIQIIDKDRRSMFQDNTAITYDYATILIQEVGDTVNDLPNRIAIMDQTSVGDVGTGPDYGV